MRRQKEFMVLRPLKRLVQFCRGILLASLVVTGAACVTVDETSALRALERSPNVPIGLPEAEHMIDDLDRIMTAFGTISIKTPDVWGQDRLAKFRSEYEAQMAGWLKQGFKSDINASVRHTESEATRVMVGANVVEPLPSIASSNATSSTATNPSAPTVAGTGSLESMLRSQAVLNPGPTLSAGTPDKTPVGLEPTVVLDEHSSYLNHLNQLRRINAGDDLTDRPGYGLYLIRIPVTLSPGPRSRRGKGAIITVSAKSVMTRHTLRSALRNAVINETVANLTQAIMNHSGKTAEQDPGLGGGSFALLSVADTELYHGAANIALLKSEAERQLAASLGDEPHHQSARVAEWLRGELQSSYHLLEEAATPAKAAELASRSRSARRARRRDPQARLHANRPDAARQEPRLARLADRRREIRRAPRCHRAAPTSREYSLLRPAHRGGRRSIAGSSKISPIRIPSSLPQL